MADKVITTSNDALNNRKHIQQVKISQPGVLHEISAVNIAFTFKGMKKVNIYNDSSWLQVRANLTLTIAVPRGWLQR